MDISSVGAIQAVKQSQTAQQASLKATAIALQTEQAQGQQFTELLQQASANQAKALQAGGVDLVG